MPAFDDDVVQGILQATLNIKDASTSQNVPVAGATAVGDDKYIQTVSIGSVPLIFNYVTPMLGVICAGGSKAVISMRFDNPTSTAKVRLMLCDKNGIKSLTEEKQIYATDIIDDDGSYISENVVFDILGATTLLLYITDGNPLTTYIAII